MCFSLARAGRCAAAAEASRPVGGTGTRTVKVAAAEGMRGPCRRGWDEGEEEGRESGTEQPREPAKLIPPMYPGRRGRYDGVADVDKSPSPNDFHGSAPHTATSPAGNLDRTCSAGSELGLSSAVRSGRRRLRSSRRGMLPLPERAPRGLLAADATVAGARSASASGGQSPPNRRGRRSVARRTRRAFVRWATPGSRGFPDESGQLLGVFGENHRTRPDTSEDSIAPTLVSLYSHGVVIPPMNAGRVQTVRVIRPVTCAKRPALLARRLFTARERTRGRSTHDKGVAQ